MARVLVVDDSEDIRDSFQMVLESEGYEVLLAEGGERALQLMREQRPDLVVTDILMAGMSGLELITHLRSDYPVPPIIVAVSGFPDVQVPALRRGADLFLGKPVNLPDLLACLRRLLEGSHPDPEFAYANTLLRRAGINQAAEHHLEELSRTEDGLERLQLVPRWLGMLTASDCLLLFVRAGELRVIASNAPERYPSDLGRSPLVRILHGVLEGGAPLLLGSGQLARDLGWPDLRIAACPLLYCEQAVGVVALLRESYRSFEVYDLRQLELIAKRGSQEISALTTNILSPGRMVLRRTFVKLTGILVERVRDGNYQLALVAVRTRRRLADAPLRADEPVSEYLLAELDEHCVASVLSGDSDVVLRAQTSALLHEIDERWGQEAAVTGIFATFPEWTSGDWLVRQLVASLATAPKTGTTLSIAGDAHFEA